MRRATFAPIRVGAVIAGNRRVDRVRSAGYAVLDGWRVSFQFVGAGVEFAREGRELLGQGGSMLFGDFPQAGGPFAEKLHFLA